ncbi:MAG TPA: phospholipase D-like domain-containing protein [Solirubrobacterales bacterium]|nr:phospholipase D-like domain-containing protein [Solirubrobacterales bacterium]
MSNPQERVLTFARSALLERIAGAESRIWLSSPFVTAAVAGEICKAAAESKAVDRRLLTDLDERAVRCGVLDPEALEHLRSCGFEIASIANLHAKVSLVDSGWALVGSGNLTGAGLGGEEEGGNYEMGVVLGPALRSFAAEIFVDWWHKAKPTSAEELTYFAGLPKFPKKWNRRVGPTLPPPAEASLEEILVEDPATAATRRYWINSNYHNPVDEKWWERGWVSDWAEKSYKKDDLLVVYLGKRNEGPSRCPAILRVTELPRHEPGFVRRERDLEAAERWPWVTRTTCLEDRAPFQGVSLDSAGITYRSVQRGCELSRGQFEAMARELLAAQ